MFFKKYLHDFVDKLKIELSILFNNLGYIIFYVFVLVYIASTLGRNLAYYRSSQDTRLKDLGFDLIPELPDNYKYISEVIIMTNLVIGVLIVFSPLIFNPMKNSYSLILIGKRLITILGIGHVIRILMYISTSLPSPANHCQPGSDNYHPPDNIIEIFTRFSTYKDLNCGDLIFSGHMFQSISFTILTCLYSNRMFNLFYSNLLSYLQILLTISQAYFIIAARNHYSIDIVVAIYVSFSLWYINLINNPIDDEEKLVNLKLRRNNEIELDQDFIL